MAKVNKTTDKDMGAKRIVAEAKRIKGSFTTIGVQDTGEYYEEGLVTVAEVAFWNEFGTSTSPERSFLRSTIDENRPDLDKLTAALIKEILLGKIDTEKALQKIGLKIQELIKKKILEYNEIPNALSTVARKGFNNPLVNTRRLWRSIAHKARIKGGVA